MIINFTSNGVYLELSSQCERNEFVQLFFHKLQDVVHKENHPHKYDGPKQIERILNHVSYNNNIKITFKYKNDPFVKKEIFNFFCEYCESTHYIYKDEKEFRVFYCSRCNNVIEKVFNGTWTLKARDIDIIYLDKIYREFKKVYRHHAGEFI